MTDLPQRYVLNIMEILNTADYHTNMAEKSRMNLTEDCASVV